MIRLITAALRGYKRLVSPLFGNRCRFHPSCADYSIEAFQKFGFIKGVWLTGWRLFRCNPLSKGGIDPV